MFKPKKGDNEGMMTKTWGPPGWIFLHSTAQNYPWKPTTTQQKKYLAFFKLIGNPNNYDFFLNNVMNQVEKILIHTNLFNLYFNIDTITLTDMDKYSTFFIKVAKIFSCNLLKSEYTFSRVIELYFVEFLSSY
jgi:hypothetical protein